MQIKNSNGLVYDVLNAHGKFMLVENKQASGHERYIVVFNWMADYKTWQHGRYFDSLAAAETYFNEKTAKTGVEG